MQLRRIKLKIIRNSKISTKISIIIIVTIVINTVAGLINTTAATNELTENLVLENLKTSMSAKIAMIEQRTFETFGLAIAASRNSYLINSLSEGNESLVHTIASQEIPLLMSMGNFDFFVVTDINGYVVYSNILQHVGEPAIHIPSVSHALVDQSIFSDIEIHGFVPFASVTSIPLYTSDGLVVGSIIVGSDLANQSLVDYMSNQINVAVTMFAGSERVMTSIENLDGMRAVGTFLEEPMYSIVFSQGQALHGDALILDQAYFVYYRPIFDNFGHVIGSFFVGINIAELSYAHFWTNVRVIIIAAISTAIGILIAFIMTKHLITKPIFQITSSFELLSTGNMNVKMPSTDTKDEIGSLSRAGTQMSYVISSLIKDVNNSVEDVLKGKLRVRIDYEKYKGDFSLLARGVNKVIGAGEKDTNDIFESLKGFSAGDFSVPLRELPGERKIYNEIVESLRFNLKDIASQLGDIIKAASDGDIDKRTDFEKHKGDWAEILIGINQFLEIIEKPINEAKNSLQSMQAGDFSMPITGDYHGIFDVIKTSVNKTGTTISSYLTEISETLAHITNDDDFTNKINRNYKGSFDPIKQSINDLIDKLNKIIRTIADNAEDVLKGAEVIAKTSSSIANGATEQSINLNNLSSSLDELILQVDSNYESACEATKFSHESQENSNIGNKHMQTTLAAMSEISESSNDILSILKVINDIAFQTNLLALNAAIEAARAGTHGRGFAIVAEEVRALAGRSESASKETNEKVLDIISKIESGQKSTENTSKSFERILESAEKVSTLIKKIELQSQEQNNIIKQISQNTTQISEVVSSNTGLSEESAASSEDLNNRAENMNTLVKQYKIR